MSDDRDLRQDLAFERWWDRLVQGRPVRHEVNLDPGLEAFAQRVHVLNDHPPLDPAFKNQLWEDLMNASPGTAALPRLSPGLNGRTYPVPPFVIPSPRTAPRSRRRDQALAVSNWTAFAALLAIILGTIFFIYQNQHHTAAPTVQETPTVVATVTPGEWTIFRGNPERNGAMPGPGVEGLPVILWQYAAGSPTRISPVIAEGMVFLSPDGPEFVALDAKTGEPRWHIDVTAGPLALADGVVYTLSEDGSELVAHDTVTAEELWRVTPGNGLWSALPGDGILYYGGDPNLLVAYDAKTGEVRWTSAQHGFASRSAALAAGVLVVGSEDHHVYGIDQATGATRWSFDAGGEGTLQTPAILNGVVYVGFFGDATNTFFALNLQTGERLWQAAGVDDEGFWAPGAAGGLVYVPTDGGRLYADDATTGQTRWTFTAGGPLKSAPAIVDGVVYLAGDDGILVALDAATGAELWRLPLDGSVTFGPILTAGVLYVSTANGSLYAITGQNEATPVVTPATLPTSTPAKTQEASIAEFVWASTGGEGYRLTNPMVARIAPDRTLWVSDASGRFFIFDLDGNLIEVWGSHGTAPGQFDFTDANDFGGCFTFAPDGSLYVADTFNQRIQHFDRGRNLIGSFGESGTGDGQFLAPMGITFAPDGNILVADPYRADVQRFTPDGVFLGRFDGTGTPGGMLAWPNGLAVASDGSIWVGELEGHRVRHFTSDGQEIGALDPGPSAGGGFNFTHDLVIDSNGYIYVADQENYAIKVFDAAGRFVAEWGSFGSNEGQLGRPAGIAINQGGAVYVAEYRNGRIQKFKVTLPVPASTPVP